MVKILNYVALDKSGINLNNVFLARMHFTDLY